MKIGFIGCGNMATAMIRGILASGAAGREDVMASARSEKTKTKIAEELQIAAASSNREVVEFADVVFLAVKPQYYEEILAEIAGCEKEGKVFVSIAPGKTIAWLQERLGVQTKVVRAMPNTPAMAGAGMTGFCKSAQVTQEETEMICRLCDSFGQTEVVPEALMDVVVGVSGSSPAYVFLFIEAMADAAVADGMPRAQAYKFAAQAVMGSAKLMLETGEHPGVLKDMVCSPAGTTIEAVRVLEEKGLRSAVMEAQKACVKKAREM